MRTTLSPHEYVRSDDFLTQNKSFCAEATRAIFLWLRTQRHYRTHVTFLVDNAYQWRRHAGTGVTQPSGAPVTFLDQGPSPLI